MYPWIICYRIKRLKDMQKVSKTEDEAKEKPSNHLRVGLIACVVVILLIVVGVMLLHLHNTNKPQNEVPISEMETEEDDVVFSGVFRRLVSNCERKW